MAAGTVVVGGGQAGYQVAASLRAGGYGEAIHIVSDEADLPYQRPPLSKGWLAGKQDDAALPFRPEAFYRDQRIELRLGARVAAIDPAVRRIRLADGAEIAWDALVLATGARPRPLPVPGADLDGVFCLRSRADAAAIRERMADVRAVAVIGGGFIGLEVAAAAAAKGLPVTVFEARERMMPRLVAPVVSEWYRGLHAAHGVDFVPAAAVAAIEGADGRAAAVRVADGTRHPAELVVVGIGVVPNEEVAAAAGLACGDGIRVDAAMRTAHPSIYAIGDCASHPNPFAGGHVRLESVQNAADQARVAAAGLLGRDARYDSVPWFWTDQFDARLQMAGLSRGHDRFVRRGEPESGRFSVFYFRAGRLVAVDSVNRPADHLAARRLLAAAAPLTPAEAGDASFDLKAALARVPPGGGRVTEMSFDDREHTARDPSAHPPAIDPAYRSTTLRGPKHAPVPLPQTLSELTGPAFGPDAATPLDGDLTRNGRTGGEPIGERIVVAGRVVDEGGVPVPGALIEIWQANAAGRYVHTADTHDAPLDPNFFGAGRVVTDGDGRYRFLTVRPGAYPWGNHANGWRPPHIHLSLFGPTIVTRLVTQMYFEGDPLLPHDPIYLSTPDPAARERLLARLDFDIGQEGFALGYRFDVVLRGRRATPGEG